MAKETDNLDSFVTVAQAADLFGRSARWVKGLRSDGYIPAGRGRSRLPDVCRGVIAYYEDRLRQGTKAEAANRATLARTREIELRTAERARKLVPVDDSLTITAEIAQMARAEFSSLPARVTRDRRLRREMETVIDDIFERLARKAKERGEDLRTGRLGQDS